MKSKTEENYTVTANGMPDFGKIPKATIERIAKKFLEDILNEINDGKTGGNHAGSQEQRG